MDTNKTNLTKTAFISILDAIAHDVVIVNDRDEVDHANIKAKTNLFSDYNRNISQQFEALIKKIHERHNIEPFDELYELMQETDDEKNFISTKLKISLTKGNNLHYYEVHTSPIYDAVLGYIGRIWQFRDITEREKLDQMKSDFMSISSHQLRTPLTSIRGYMDMVLDGDFGDINENLNEPLQAIAKASEEMSNLINDLLNISRLEKRSDSEDSKTINLIALINEIITEIKAKYHKKNVEIKVKSPDDTINMYTDLMKITESLKNLIDNAVKYSPGDAQINVNIIMADKGKVRIDVADQGVGIPRSQQSKIFQKFFRANNVLTENFNGTGIGLYYVKQALESIGGYISFVSEEGEGTTFTIAVPLRTEVQTKN